MQNFLQNNKFFVSIVTLCDIFYSRFKRFFGPDVFFYKIDFSLKNKLRELSPFFAVFVFFNQPIACSVCPGKNMAFLIFIFFLNMRN